MKTILITGSTGFLGKHLVEQLLEAEPETRLRLLCRSTGPDVKSDRIEVVVGDILDREAVRRAAEGVSEIYHLAGLVEREPADPWRLYNVHVEGTRNVCEVMRDMPGVKAVFASTSGVCAVGREPAELDETAPYAQEVVWDWPYYTSKIYAEKLALWYVEHRKLNIVHVNPSLILGPGDDRRSSTRDVEMFLEGQIKVIPLGGLNLVDVRDAARGCILAMQRGLPGERYLLGGANMTFYEWIRRAAKLSGARAPKMMVPLPVSLWGARVLRKVLPLFGRRFDLDDASVRMSAVYWYCNSQKARAELGFTTRDPDVTLRDTIAYLRASARS
jgi:dihydroflavonol-4-reductase